MSTIKFELTDETKLLPSGVTVHRIRATEDIPARSVRKDDLGGWVESTHRSDGEPRISGDARVYGDARVSGDARVESPGDVFTVGPIGSEGVHATLARTPDGHTLTVGCWIDGTLDTLMEEVTRRARHWEADDATQTYWTAQYEAFKTLGQVVTAQWVTQTSEKADA